MSSSYNNDLRLEMIGTGDQAGVWGATTNTNLGTLLVDAIVGYTSVGIIASPQALTANDGAADQARNASIALTTSTGANFTVCIPPNPKLYTFYNASSYVATISNSTINNGTTLSGGTTVLIPAGKTMSVWSDGTNVAQQNDQFTSPAMSSPTMTGTPIAPTASFGTSTTQVATTAFVQAALQALHPVGSIYTNVTSTNPATLFGFGTWVAFGAGKVMVGYDGTNTLFDSAEETGGSYDAINVSHTHTASAGNQSTDHTHNFSGNTGTTSLTGTFVTIVGSAPTGVFTLQASYGGTGGDPQTNYRIGMDASHLHSFSGTTGTQSASHNHAITVDSAGSSGTNANIQPYITVYMWKRTA